jgi:hypothetical protein
MRRGVAVLMSLSLFVLGPIPQLKVEAKKYKNCTELRKVFPKGVAGTKSAARKSGAKYEPKVYAANKSKDRDRDGAACES